jgi:hypothetical protein
MKFLRSALLLATTLVTTLAVAATPVMAGAAPAWPASRIVALPAGAKGVPEGYLPALACSSAGNCVAGGAYANAAGSTEGLLLSQVGGQWRAPVTIAAPSGAAASALVTVYSAACGANGDCSAVGTYQDKAGDSLGFVDNEVGGTWRGAIALSLPANAAAAQDAQIRSIACPSPGNCSAVGTYSQKSSPLSLTEGLVINEVGGTWQRGLEVRLPAGTNVDPFVTLSQVACSSTGNCSAVGSYIDANGATHALIVNEAASRWASGLSVALPDNASAFPNASLSAVSCQVSCVAIGTFDNGAGQIEGLAVSESGRVWKRGTALSMPANAAANPRVFFYGYNALACDSATNCAAGGQYVDNAGNYQGFLVNDVKGTWQGATELKLPGGAPQSGKNGGVVALSCPTSANCSAGAAFLDSSGNYQALVVNRVNGTWLTGIKVTLPGGAASVGVDGGVYGLICKAANQCSAIGSYEQTSTVYQGFTLTAG